jgi:Domain of unknown function (DUF4062)
MRIKVFVSSPSDVRRERKKCGAVIQELNTTLRVLLPDKDVQLDLLRWETDTHPDLTDEPQAVVDAQIPTNYDIFLGIMWARFGTPTSSAGSGTESEFEAARRGWEKKRKPSHLLFYFCDDNIPPTVDVTQLAAVQEFRDKLNQLGLVGSYKNHTVFADILRKNLVRVISGIINPGDEQPGTPGATDAARVEPTQADRVILLDELAAEANLYERIREDMDAGDPRTRRMELVASRMRALSQSAWPLLRELKTSDRPGLRLAAVSTLEAIPASDHVDWLAERLCDEAPFVGYHAAIALLTAARELPPEHLEQLDAALQRAIDCAKTDGRGTDRMVTLESARREVRRRRRLVE